MNAPTKTPHARGCCCPACETLNGFQRPVFAPNQLLRASDLNDIQAYLRGKNRLHNRRLHGSGVVCGLEVLCHDCEGSASITPGYAISPCGDDIVVPDAVRLDILKAVEDCLHPKRAATGDCDPWAAPRDPGCDDAETHWCVWIRYKELETAFTRSASAAGSGKTADCGCGCGGKSLGGCGCGGQATAAGFAAEAVSASGCVSAPGCEPRRILEGFEVGVMPSREGCAANPFAKTGRGGDLNHVESDLSSLSGVLGAWAGLIPDDSLFARAFACLSGLLLKPYMAWPAAQREALVSFMDAKVGAAATASQLHSALARYRGEIMTALEQDARPVRCALRRNAGAIAIPAAGDGMKAQAYRKLALPAFHDLADVHFQLVLDCLCHALLPPCAPDPCDDRLALACVVVRHGRIQRICNTSCRSYAGAFPTAAYWMSAVPILPAALKLINLACCAPDADQRGAAIAVDPEEAASKLNPKAALYRMAFADDFALPRKFLRAMQTYTPAAALAGVGDKIGAAAASLQAAAEKPSFAARIQSLEDELVALKREAELKPGGLP